MVNVFHRLRYKIRKHLSGSDDIRNEYKKIILTIQITLVAIIACLIFAILDYFRSYYISVIINFSAAFIFTLSLFLISKGKFNIAKLMVLVYSCIALTINASKDGRDAGNEFLWFPIISGVFLFFSSKEKFYIFVSFIITATSIMWLEYTDYSYNIHTFQSTQYKYINYSICFSVSIIMVCLYMYYLIKLNSDSEIKLAKLNHILLVKNENLRKTNNELDSFVYKASHDMRAPLTSLLGLISLSKKETDLSIVKGFIDLQEKSIIKLDNYIVDILNMSKNARTEVQYSEINFREIIDHVFAQLIFLEVNHSIDKQLIIDTNERYWGDAARINIILNNLISNSLRYIDQTKPHCTIKITIKADKTKAIISVYDNGIGIPSMHLEHVFNMFYRATEKTNGSGLGLYIVKETVTKLNGTVRINSEVGKYTEVTIELPNTSIKY